MRFRSVCSGIEAASVAWAPLGWECVEVAEIDPFPRAVLARRYPEVPNAGDFTSIRARPRRRIAPADVLVGGTPCQSFSVAGLRKGLDDERGRLAIEFLGLAHATRPRWVVWENVPGVLSSGGGRDLGSFLGGLGELGYGWAYRVLDAQYIGVPQRRRRVFVVGHLGDWRRAAAVLFERHDLSGDPPPGRDAGEDVAGTLAARAGAGGGLGTDFECDGGLIASTLRARHNLAHDVTADTLVAHALRGDGFDASEDGTGRGTLLVACTLPASDGGASSGYHPVVPVAFHANQDPISGEISPCLPTHTGHIAVATRWAVRRLTPRECERLQGFPDDWTLVPYRGKPAADGPRYKAIGNSMAVPCMRWIGERIRLVDELCGPPPRKRRARTVCA